MTFWVEGLKQGDADAAARLWDRYFQRLVRLAQRKLGTVPRRVVDEEDVVVSVFRCLCDHAARGRLPDLQDRDGLWRLLVTMTLRKAIDQKRWQLGAKRGGGRVRGDSFAERGDSGERQGRIELFVAAGPSPETLVMLEELRHRLFAALDDKTLRNVAQWKLEGYTNDEIAQRLELTTRSVERKLQRIREKWSSFAPSAASDPRA